MEKGREIWYTENSFPDLSGEEICHDFGGIGRYGYRENGCNGLG